MLLNKNNMNRILPLILTFVILSGVSFSLSIGTAPGVADLGDVQRGEQVPVSFYVTSDTKSPLPIKISYMPVHATIFKGDKKKDQGSYYTFIPSEASEENIEDWLSIPKRPFVLSPGSVKICGPPECDPPIKYNQKITFFIKVPKDAEPGYHAGSVNINPDLNTASQGGTAVSTIGITRFVFVFRVPGNALREGRIIDFVADRESKNRVRIDTLFKNTGTDTITARLDNLKIYDEFGEPLYSISNGNVVRLEPGKTAILSSYINDEDGIPSGEFKSEAKVSYITGFALKDSLVKIPSEITLPKDLYAEETSFPWWIIVVILLLAGLYVYWKM